MTSRHLCEQHKNSKGLVNRKLARSALAMALFAVGLTAHPMICAQEAGIAGREVRKRVTPDYPELARRVNLTGKVKIEVVIAADGRVMSTHSLGGHPVLVEAAEKAIKQWRFAPAVDTTTQVVVLEFVGTDTR